MVPKMEKEITIDEFCERICRKNPCDPHCDPELEIKEYLETKTEQVSEAINNAYTSNEIIFSF